MMEQVSFWEQKIPIKQHSWEIGEISLCSLVSYLTFDLELCWYIPNSQKSQKHAYTTVLIF